MRIYWHPHCPLELWFQVSSKFSEEFLKILTFLSFTSANLQLLNGNEEGRRGHINKTNNNDKKTYFPFRNTRNDAAPLTRTALSGPLPVTCEHHGVEKAQQMTGEDSRGGEDTSRLSLHTGKEGALLRDTGSFASIISSLWLMPKIPSL